MPRTKAVHAAADATQARSRILKAARKVFAERGYDDASTRLIAEAADVPTGLVFYYFKNKEQLLEATLGEDTIIEALGQAFREFGGTGDPITELTNVNIALYEWLDNNRELAHILFREITSHRPIAKRVRALRARSLGSIEAYLTEHIAAGRLRPLNAAVAAQVLASSVMLAVIVDRPADPAVYVAELVALLLA